VEHLEDRSVPSVTLTNSALDFGSDPVGVVNPSPRATTLLNQDPNNVLVSVTAGGPNASDFTVLSGPTVGQALSTTATQSFRFAFTPSTQGAEAATYSIATTDGTLTVSLTGTGTSPIGLTALNLDFGSVSVGTPSPSVRSTSLLNLDPNNVLLGITASGPNAADFPLVAAPTVGQPLPTTAPQAFRFGFTPTTTGTESATYSIVTTFSTRRPPRSTLCPCSALLRSLNLDFGSVSVGTPSPSVRSTSLLNLDPNNVLLGITASGPNATDFQLVAAPTVGQPIPTSTPQAFRFSFDPTTTGTESATYTLNTTDGTLIVTLTGTGAGPATLTSPNLNFGSVSVGTPSPSVRSTSVLNQNPNNVLLGITASGPNASDFELVLAPTVGQPLPTLPTISTLRFSFTPTTLATETATFTLNTTDGPLVITLTGTGVNSAPPALSLNHSSVSFGNVPQGTGATPLGVGIWNYGQNVQLLGVSSTSPQAADFPLVTPVTAGQALPIATSSTSPSLNLQFGFDPSTIGNESATYTIQTTAGSFNVTLTGTGISPVTLNHSSVAFGNVPQGTGATPLGVGIWNYGQNVQLLGVSSTSPQAADFPLVTPVTAGQALPIATSSTSPSLNLQFGFDPSTIGNESATYTIQTTAGSFNVTLTGTGISPLSLSRPSLDFGSVPVGVGALPLSVSLWNFGQNVQILGVSSTSLQAADFPLLTPVTSGQALAVAQPVTATASGTASLTLQFGFVPSAVGTESATYTIQTSAGDLTLNLTGTGGSSISLSPANLDFGSVPVGTPAQPQTVTLQNLDPNNVLLSITTSGANPNDFHVFSGPSIGQTLGAGSAQFLFAFVPSVMGSESATVTFHTTDGDLTLNLTGTGTSPISLIPTSSDFGAVPLGTPAQTPLTVTLQNLDPNNNLLSVTTSGANPNDFPLFSGPSIGALGAGSYQFLFTFVPSVIGSESETVTFHTTDGDLALTLTGTGTSPISLSPTSSDFGSVALGTPAPTPLTVTLQNLDPNNNLLSVTTSGANPNDFPLVAGPSPGPIGAGPEQFLFTFVPSTIGSESATVTFHTTDGDLTLNLTGTGASPISLSPLSLNFGSVPLGNTTPSPLTADLQNLDPNNSLLGVTVGGANPNDFQLVAGPPLGPIGAGSEQFLYTFTPTVNGPESATVTFQTTDGALVLTLTGTGVSPAFLDATTLAFGSDPVGVTNPAPRSTALVNQDPNDVLLSVTPAGANPSDFTLLSGPAVGATLGVGPQTFRFAFTPSTSGPESATYTITTTDGSAIVTLTGQGTSPISLAEPNLAFGAVPVGVTNPSPRSAALLNQDPNNVLLSVTPGGADPGDFTLLSGPTVGATLGVGSQTFRFAFTPSTSGSESATFTITTTDGTEVIHLSGSGSTPISLATTSLAFGTVPVGVTNPAPRSTALVNQDPNDVLLSVTPAGANPSDFTLLSGPAVGATLGVGPQTFRFAFTPSTSGPESATYTITTTDGAEVVHLSGSGSTPISLATTSLAFGTVPVGVTNPAPRSTALLNQDPDNVLLSVTPGGANPGDFVLLSSPAVGTTLGVGPQTFRFAFTPTALGNESATYTIVTTDGTLVVNLSGRGVANALSPTVSLSHSSLSFGKVMAGTSATPLSVGVWNFGQNVQILGVTSTSPQAADFQLLTAITPGQLLPVAQSVAGDPLGTPSLDLQFAFTPSTTGSETVTYVIHTSAGDLTLTLTGTGS